MRGDKVIVRSFGDRPLVRRVWSANEHGVYISAEQEFEKLTRGEEALSPVGFPREDVFEFDPEVAATAERANGPDQFDWGRLNLWEGGLDAR
jgi:hypothetical protein